jgi:formylglycine-generating enzyme required for sulfatase activity
MRTPFVAVLLAAAVAASPARAGTDVPVSPTVDIPAGPYIAGSDASERETAYALDAAAYGGPVTRDQRWYAGELPRRIRTTGAYAITATPITNAQYGAFVAATGHPAPDVDAATWASYGLMHPFARTRRFAWRDRLPPVGRDAHPVVLVSQTDAAAYAAWLSEQTGAAWSLPSEDQWEKAARGVDGRLFPWGNDWNADYLDSADAGPFDTVPVGSYPAGISPYGLLDGAGLIFEWTRTAAGAGRHIVKGGSWDDRGCGVCRLAARHGRPTSLRHILIGFRLVRETS